MFDIEKLEDISLELRKRIINADKPYITDSTLKNITRFYGYVSKEQGDYLVVVVAVKKNRKNNLICKQVSVHAINEQCTYVKDFNLTMNGYTVDWYLEGMSSYPKWYGGGDWYQTKSNNSFIPTYTSWLNNEFFDSDEEFKYSAARDCLFYELPKYLGIYRANPKVELLQKAGLTQLITSASTTKWLGRPEVLKFIRDNLADIKKHRYRVREIQHAMKHNTTLENARRSITTRTAAKCCSTETWFRPYKDDIKKLDAYLNRQKADFYYFADYVKACEYLHLDMSDTKNLFPIDLKYWHDKRIEEKELDEKAKIIKRNDPKVWMKIVNKYKRVEMNINGFAFILAKSVEELILEGDALNHCVGRMGYDDKVVNEKSLIVFVRKQDHQDKSLATMEYSLAMRKQLQLYAINNTRPSEDLIEAADKWAEKIKHYRFAA